MEKINFKKKYGQNFLSDTNLLKAIVSDSLITPEDEVLEIGAGAGALTQELAKSAKKVVSFEIDKSLENILFEKLNSYNNVELIFSDILNIKTQEIDNLFQNNYKIVANLPYYITSPIIFKFLEESKKLDSMTIMVQKEVAEKMLAKSRTSTYGVLTVMVNYYADVKITRIVKKQMFTPMPKVDSAIVYLKLKQKPFDKEFKRFIQTAFSMRRKTLLNNLLKLYKKEDIESVFNKLNISLNTRAEELSVTEFETLYNSFRQK